MMNETNDDIEDLLVPNGYFVNFRGGKEQPKNAGDGDNPLIGSGGSFGFIDDFNHSGNGVIFGRKGTINKPFPINGQFWMIDTAYFAVPDSHYLEPRYYSYWAETVPFDRFMTNTARPSTTAHALARQKIPLYPLSEQERIADYLDAETAEIDRMATHLDELIEELEHRQANTIREKMGEARDLAFESGNSVLPDLGYETVLMRRGISPTYLEDENDDTLPSIRVLNQKCVRSGSRIDYSFARRNDLSKKSVADELLIRPGDVLINSTGTGTLGRTALVREVSEPTTIDSHVTLVRSKTSVEHRFLGYFMLNSEDILVLESRGSTNQIELSQSTISWLEFPLPPIEEQRRIADYLDEETARIDKLKSTATELRHELLARRKALITEVVTGQKRIG